MVAQISSFTIQCRAIAALMLFEIHTLYGDARLGYIWALVKTAFGVLALLLLRIFAHARAPHGIPSITFLVMGFMIWQIFSQTLNKTMTVIRNKALFAKGIDPMQQRCLVTHAVVFCWKIVQSP